MFQLLLGALSGPTPNFAQLLLGFDVEDGPEGARVFHRRFLTVLLRTASQQIAEDTSNAWRWNSRSCSLVTALEAAQTVGFAWAAAQDVQPTLTLAAPSLHRCLPAGVASVPVNPRREFTCLTVALTAFASPLLPTLRPQLHEVRLAPLTVTATASWKYVCSPTKPAPEP